MSKLFLTLVTLILLVSCNQPKPSKPIYIETYKILIAKNIETVNATALSSGYTKYLLAFNDGWTQKTSFGYYSCLKIGDTIKFTKKEGDADYWLRMLPNCN